MYAGGGKVPWFVWPLFILLCGLVVLIAVWTV